MSDTSLLFNIVARDQASSTFDKLRGKAALLGAAAATLAIKFGKDSVDAFVEAEQSQNKLQEAFRKFPGLADTNIDRLNTLNASLAKKTRFDDDATASGQAVLAQFKLTGSQIEELTPLLQDYAAKTGKDIPTAAGDLGKAMLGQGRALKAIGIDFKDTGTASGNFSELMGGLRGQVGGFAEQEGKTAAGQAEILKNQFGEVEEQVGSKLVPALTTLADKLLDVLGFVQRNAAVIGPLVVTLGGFAGTVWAVNKATSAWTSTTQAFNSVMGAFRGRQDEGAGAAKGLGGILGSGGVWGLAIAAGIGILGTFIARHQAAKQRIDEMAGSLDEATGAITRDSRAMAANNLEKDGALAAARQLGLNLRDVTSAALGNQAATDRVTASLKALVPGFDAATGTVRRHDGSSRELTGAEAELVSAMGKVTSGVNGNSDAMAAGRDKAARLREALNAIPNTTATVAIKGGQDAISEVAQLRWQLDHIPPSVTTQVLVKSGQIPRRAAGGPVSAGQAYLVGEKRPELFVPDVSGTIVPRVPSSAGMMAAGVGGTVVNNNITITMPSGSDGSDVVRKLQEWSRRNGPIRGVGIA